MKLLSIQVSMPKTLGKGTSPNPMFGQWSTGIFKELVSGPVMVRRLNLEGDGQADLTVHGGPDKAVYAYPVEHYPSWQTELEMPELTNGAFGENLTVEGALEADVAIGDVHRIGSAVLQVSQPRFPCWKLQRKWQRMDLPTRLIRSGRTGWYYRVLEEGTIEAGDEVERVARPCPQWTVKRACELLFQSGRDPQKRAEARELTECELLADAWREAIRERI